MTQPTIRFPVTCPQCGEEALGEYALADVAAALIQTRALSLFSPCHHIHWHANDSEIEQIREYLATVKGPES